jgi:hypothetical protein
MAVRYGTNALVRVETHTQHRYLKTTINRLSELSRAAPGRLRPRPDAPGVVDIYWLLHRKNPFADLIRSFTDSLFSWNASPRGTDRL